MPVVHNKAPVSNRERQRQFRARNPHYYRDLHRKRKAEMEAMGKLMAEHPDMTAGQALAIVRAPGNAPAPAPGRVAQTPQALPAQQPETPVVLALPAPEDVVNQMVTMTLPDAFTYEPAKHKIVTTPGSAKPPQVAPASLRRPEARTTKTRRAQRKMGEPNGRTAIAACPSAEP